MPSGQRGTGSGGRVTKAPEEGERRESRQGLQLSDWAPDASLPPTPVARHFTAPSSSFRDRAKRPRPLGVEVGFRHCPPMKGQRAGLSHKTRGALHPPKSATLQSVDYCGIRALAVLGKGGLARRLRRDPKACWEVDHQSAMMALCRFGLQRGRPAGQVLP